MIDTVVVTLPISLHRPQKMADLQFSLKCGHDGHDCRHAPRWRLNPPEIAATLPRLTWNRAPDGFDYLTAAASIPKLLLGSNVEMVESQADIDRALHMISRYVSDAANVTFDAKAANVTRVDYCHCWRLTPLQIYAYLRVLGRASLPRMRRDLIGGSTVLFSNKSQAVQFYDKLPEVVFRLQEGRASNEEVTASVGVLRFERRFLSYRACDRLALRLGLPNRQTENLLRVSIAVAVMNETMKQLGFDKTLESGNVRLARLIEAYGPTRAFALAGFLAACDAYGADNLVRQGLCKKPTFYRMRREIRLAGAWHVTERKGILPPLRLIQSSEQVRVA